MKKSRLSERQIAYILRQARNARASRRSAVSQAQVIQGWGKFRSPETLAPGSPRFGRGQKRNRLKLLTYEMRGAGHDA